MTSVVSTVALAMTRRFVKEPVAVKTWFGTVAMKPRHVASSVEASTGPPARPLDVFGSGTNPGASTIGMAGGATGSAAAAPATPRLCGVTVAISVMPSVNGATAPAPAKMPTKIWCWPAAKGPCTTGFRSPPESSSQV